MSKREKTSSYPLNFLGCNKCIFTKTCTHCYLSCDLVRKSLHFAARLLCVLETTKRTVAILESSLRPKVEGNFSDTYKTLTDCAVTKSLHLWNLYNEVEKNYVDFYTHQSVLYALKYLLVDIGEFEFFESKTKYPLNKEFESTERYFQQLEKTNLSEE